MTLLVILVIIALVAGVAWAWHRAAERRAQRKASETRCREERRKQLAHGVTPITSRTAKRAA